mgnify:CR=1 FL=1
MRLIDADNISFYCNYEGDCTGDIDDCKECKNYICDFRDIQEHLTAYDIDKVVEELKLHSFEFGTDSIPAHYLRFNEAIEIVKQGGVSDDACEWIKYDYRTICPKNHDANNPYWRIPDNTDKLKYCPYCGKKIKIVGDLYDT